MGAGSVFPIPYMIDSNVCNKKTRDQEVFHPGHGYP